MLKEGLAESLPAEKLEPVSVDVLAHMLLAALNELAFVIARAADSDAADAAARAGEAAVDALLGRLLAT
jgi:hypothetical protein